MSDQRRAEALIAGFYAALAACAMLETVRDATGAIVDFLVIAVNPSAERLLGCCDHQVAGTSVTSLPELAGNYASVVETGEPLVEEFRLARGGWVHRIATRTPTGVLVVLRDVSDDAYLVRSNDRFFQLSADLMLLAGADGSVKRVNPACTRVLGWTEAELLGMNVSTLVRSDGHVRCKDGSYRWIAWSNVSDGYLIGRDVTEERQQNALLKAIVEETSDVVFVKDTDGRYILVHGNTDVNGVSNTAFLGHTDAEVVPEWAPMRRASDLRVMASGEAETIEQEYMRGGTRYTFMVTKAPYRAPDGTIIGVLGVAREVTAIRRLEARMHQAQKMDAVGRLAGGVAHDFNNLLTAILSFASLAGESLVGEHPAQADLREIHHAAEEAAVLTRQMLAFSRQQILDPCPIDINDLVKREERLFKSLLGERVAITTSMDPDLAIVEVDPGQFVQVLINLVVNAGHAMSNGGHLWIETANTRVTSADAERLPGLPPGRYVRLAVRDTGVGMDEATRQRVFEPFFTTKPEGQGTGLGLSSVYGIVKQSHGGVYVESELGAGSEFAVYLPAVEAAARSLLPLAPIATPLGHETILFVEDNPAVRHAVARMLAEAGYHVLAASSGAEALELARGSVDLVVSDLVMPGMGGRMLVNRLRAGHPNLRALFISGVERDASVVPSGTAFLPKPFGADALLRAVRAVLDGAPSHPFARPIGPFGD
jgi:PAS domain S-box-containing protein